MLDDENQAISAAAKGEIKVGEDAVDQSRVIGSGLSLFDLKTFERTASYLAPDALASFMQRIAARGEILLHLLEGADPLAHDKDELAAVAHGLTGSAGMFGFELLTAVSRRFEKALETSSAETSILVEALRATINATLPELHSRITTLPPGP